MVELSLLQYKEILERICKLYEDGTNDEIDRDIGVSHILSEFGVLPE